MCGIAGFFEPAAHRSAEELASIAADMHRRIDHRGPDGEGVWVDAEAGIALAHRRLAIIDLSPGGAQPKASPSGRYHITYNGEVYNYRDIRAELQARGRKFGTESDTEVMLVAIEEWGLEAAMGRFIGMFAFALWDRQARTLTLARDRIGVKPLYWAKLGQGAIFASQPKSFFAHPDWRGDIDRHAAAALLRFNYIPAPLAIWQGMRKLEPGRYVVIRAGSEPEIRVWWDLRRVAREALASQIDLSDHEAIEQAEALLQDAVAKRLVSDVPVGAFLSGGIDSSTVVALMRKASNGAVRTCTIGFADTRYDEAAQAREVARFLGTEHTEFILEAQDALDLVPKLPDFFDEPFADSSMIPTQLVSTMTRRQVPVALSGDGGDELFAGYTRYRLLQQIDWPMRLSPWPARKLAARALTAIAPAGWDRAFEILPERVRPRLAGERLHKFAGMLGARTSDEFYDRLVRQWVDMGDLVVGAGVPAAGAADPVLPSDIPGLVDRLQYLDQTTYLPDDIMAKVDRASMAVSLEAREPLLDHRVLEFAWRLPMRFKLRGGVGKWLLRQVLYRHVPRSLVERPKMGFAVPIENWLRGPLRDWAEDLLSESALKQTGLLEPAPIRAYLAQHMSGLRNRQHALWGALMLQAWHRRWAAA
jgi:asparagine synthase (glutamine-hydrolysing)